MPGIHYSVDENGERVFTDEYTTYKKWRGIFKLVMPSADYNYWIPSNLEKEQRDAITNWLNTCIGNAVVTLDKGYSPDAQSSDLYVDFSATLNETVIKIIMGELDVSAWDDCLNEWYSNGGLEYIEQMNEYISNSAQ